MASLDEAFRSIIPEPPKTPSAPHFGLVYPHPDPENPTAIPSYAALIRKNDQGQLYVDDANWFGKFVLPADAKNDDIIRISGSRLARIALLPTCGC